MIILALDCALSSCSVSVIKDGELLSEIFEERSRGQAERILPMCQEICQRHSISFDDLEGIAVTRGPGTFTGVRIGLAAAKGLALALHIPIIGVTTLEAVARHSFDVLTGDDMGKIAVAHDARRSEIYWQIFEKRDHAIVACTEALAVPLVDIALHFSTAVSVVVGSGTELIKSALPKDIVERLSFPDISPVPRAATVGQIAYEKIISGDVIEGLVPLYLRAPDAIAARAITYAFQN